MKVKQLSIFLENRKGRLLETTRILAENKINIRALSVAETTGFGIVRLIVEETERAYAILHDNKFTLEMTDVIAIEVDDQPGSLTRVLEVISDNGLNLEYTYAFVERNKSKAVIIARIEDTERAIQILQDNGIKTLTQKELYQ
ncbi:MAG: ACT domain-containing protein [Candidatus Auribacterota bacterium]|jgi:hypothetical protein